MCSSAGCFGELVSQPCSALRSLRSFNARLGEEAATMNRALAVALVLVVLATVPGVKQGSAAGMIVGVDAGRSTAQMARLVADDSRAVEPGVVARTPLAERLETMPCSPVRSTFSAHRSLLTTTERTHGWKRR